MRLRSFSLAALLLAGTTLSGCISDKSQNRYATNAPGQQEGLSVTGHGSVEVPPDLARVRFGVMERGASATEASNAVQTKMSAILAALAQAQVPSKDVQTDRLYLRESPEYRHRQRELMRSGPKVQDPSKPTPPQRPAKDRYIAEHTVSVELRDLAKVGAVLAAVQNAGVNEIDNVSFELQNKDEAIAQARYKAIENAQLSAKLIAERAGVALGPLVFISTTNEHAGFRRGMSSGGMRLSAKSESAAPSPVQPGQLTFDAQVYLRYEIAGQRSVVIREGAVAGSGASMQ